MSLNNQLFDSCQKFTIWLKTIKNQQFIRIFPISILLLLFITGCGILYTKFLDKNQKESKQQLIVSAAVSLKDVMKAIKPIYKNNYPNQEIIYNFASSGSLQRQIEQGAPVDIFISASVNKMDILQQKGLIITETRRKLLKNQIVLVTQQENEANLNLTNFKDLTRQDVKLIALGEPKSVPAGRYAQQVLEYFNITDQVNTKAVYGKDVRQVLHYVATGNVEVGIVYRTDAKVSDQVKIIATAPQKSHSPVIYPVAIIRKSENLETSKDFINFLKTEKIQSIFKEYGFIPMTHD